MRFVLIAKKKVAMSLKQYEYYKTDLGFLYYGDCLEILSELEQIDMVLCDLPYGKTQNKWDIIIPFEKMWDSLDSIVKENGAIIFTATNPFAAELICSNRKMFRYDLVWRKIGKATGFLNANRMPLRNHELVLIFYKKLPTYNPQKTKGTPSHSKFCGGSHSRGRKQTNNNYGKFDQSHQSAPTTDKFPLSILSFSSVHPPIHPTQKPVTLMEYLIKTYTNENEIVLDFACGSGTTGVACERLNRKYILIEKEEEYCEIAKQRIAREIQQTKMF